MNNKPNLFIVGAPKCGTTSMYEYLKEHPEIFMCEPKEPRYFCKDFHKEAEKNDSKSYFPVMTKEEYERLFSDADNYKIRGEASPIYLYSKVAAENIHNYKLDAKIIIMLRDPVEQMYSWYYQSMQTGKEGAVSFEKALKLENTRKKGRQVPTSRFPSALFYNELANYAPQIERFQKYFSDEQIKFILLDDLKNRTKKTYRETLKFLGVEDQNFTPKFEVVNTGKVPRSKWINNKVKNPGRKIRKLIKSIFPKSLLRSGMDLFNKLIITNQKRDPMPNKLREKLMQKHKKNVKKTAELIGRDLEKIWGYKEL